MTNLLIDLQVSCGLIRNLDLGMDMTQGDYYSHWYVDNNFKNLSECGSKNYKFNLLFTKIVVFKAQI